MFGLDIYIYICFFLDWDDSEKEILREGSSRDASEKGRLKQSLADGVFELSLKILSYVMVVEIKRTTLNQCLFCFHNP